jgi:hypothetical protein
MIYVCGNPDCQKHFNHPAKVMEHRNKETIKHPDMTKELNPIEGDFVETEFTLCPFCRSVEYTEFVEPIVEEEVTNVLTIEFGNVGAQLAIDRALADGYKIVGRYAKSYTLEKCKEKTQP